MDLSHRRQLIQALASVALMVGVFLPVRAMRYWGSQSLFSEDATIAVLLLVLGLISLIMSIRAATRWVPLLGAIALLAAVVALVSTISTVRDPQAWPEAPLASALTDRPAHADIQPSLRWSGWILMLLGAAGLCASQFIRIETEERAAVVTGAGRYRIEGFERDTGSAVSTLLDAQNAKDAEDRAVRDGIIVTGVSFEPIRKNPLDRILGRGG